MRGVNLIPAPRLALRQKRRRWRGWLTAAAIYAGVLLAGSLGIRLGWSGEARHAAAAAELVSVQQDIVHAEAAAAELRPRLARAMTTLAATRGVGEQPDWSLLLTLLADLLGDEAVLSSCKLAVPAAASPQPTEAPCRLELMGLGKSHAAVLAYVARLEATGLFESVTLIDARQTAHASGTAVAFRLECLMLDDAGEQP